MFSLSIILWRVIRLYVSIVCFSVLLSSIPQFVQLFICWRLSGLFSVWGYYKQSCFDYSCTVFFSFVTSYATRENIKSRRLVFYLSIHRLIDILVVSTLLLLWIMLLCAYSWVYIVLSRLSQADLCNHHGNLRYSTILSPQISPLCFSFIVMWILLSPLSHI